MKGEGGGGVYDILLLKRGMQYVSPSSSFLDELWCTHTLLEHISTAIFTLILLHILIIFESLSQPLFRKDVKGDPVHNLLNTSESNRHKSREEHVSASKQISLHVPFRIGKIKERKSWSKRLFIHYTARKKNRDLPSIDTEKFYHHHIFIIFKVAQIRGT